jgi:hypothetical protein
LFFLHADMPPEAKYLPGHCFLEAIGKGQGDDHYGYTDNGSHDGQPDNEPRK